MTTTRPARPRLSPKALRATRSGLSSTAAVGITPTGQATSTSNNNRREVEPLQASTPGPLQTAAPIAKDAYRLNRHLQRNHCKMAAVLVVDDDGLFDDHRDEHEWPPAVQLLLASPQELQRRGLAAAP